MSRKRCIYGWGVSIEEEGQSQQAGQCLLSRFLGPFKWHSSESTGEKGLYLYIGISVFFSLPVGGSCHEEKKGLLKGHSADVVYLPSTCYFLYRDDFVKKTALLFLLRSERSEVLRKARRLSMRRVRM